MVNPNFKLSRLRYLLLPVLLALGLVWLLALAIRPAAAEEPEYEYRAYRVGVLTYTLYVHDNISQSCSISVDGETVTCDSHKFAGSGSETGHIQFFLDYDSVPEHARSIRSGGLGTGVGIFGYKFTYDQTCNNCSNARQNSLGNTGNTLQNINISGVANGTLCRNFTMGDGWTDAAPELATDCDGTMAPRDSSWAPDSNANRWGIGPRHDGSNSVAELTISDIYVIARVDLSQIEDEPIESGYGASCVITSTVPITNGNGITPTYEIISQTVPASIIKNGSFEMDAAGNESPEPTFQLPPLHWQPVNDGGQVMPATNISVFPAWAMETPGDFATDGSYALWRQFNDDRVNVRACQAIWLPPQQIRSMRIGFDARQGANSTHAGNVRATWNELQALEIAPGSSYAHYDDLAVHQVFYGGGGVFCITASGTEDTETIMDRVYAYAYLDEEGTELYCPDPAQTDPMPQLCPVNDELWWTFDTTHDNWLWPWTEDGRGGAGALIAPEGGPQQTTRKTDDFMPQLGLPAGHALPGEGTSFSGWINVTGIGGWGRLVVQYTDGSTSEAEVMAGGWNYAFVPASPGKYVAYLRLEAEAAEGGSVRFDDLRLSVDMMVDCAMLQPPVEEPPPMIPGPGDPSPVPPGGPAPYTCYACPVPGLLDGIGSWVGYLGCVINNLFACSLRIWFFNVINSIFGIINWALNLSAWLVNSAQTVLNWAGNMAWEAFQFIANLWDRLRIGLVNLLRSIITAIMESQFLQTLLQGTLIGEFVLNIIGLTVRAIITIVADIVEALANIIRIIVGLVRGVIEAFGAEPVPIIIVTGDQEVELIDPDLLHAPGANAVKVLWMMVVALSTFDDIVGEFNIQALLLVPLAIIGFTVIMWTMNLWKEILPS